MKKRLTELKEELKSGITIDVDYYVETGTNEIHAELVRNGLGIEQLTNTKAVEVIVALIKNGYATERYDEFKNHTDSRVRMALAYKGLYPEEFSMDKHHGVRGAVAIAHPEYFEKIIPTANIKAIVEVARKYLNQSSINPEHINVYLERLKFFHSGTGLSNEFIDALKLKYEAAQQTSLLVTTINEIQLFKMQDAHWTNGLTPRAIKSVMYWHQYYHEKGQEEKFYQIWETEGVAQLEQDYCILSVAYYI